MPNPVIRGDRKVAKVALTFDACPTIPQGKLEERVIDFKKNSNAGHAIY